MIDCSDEFDVKQIQGNILRGYRRDKVRYLMLAVTDRAAARRFLGIAASGGDADTPGITAEMSWTRKEDKPATVFNIGITIEGLKALGVPEASLAAFPTEFVQGMARRATKLGDVGISAPAHWPAPFDKPERIHLIANIHVDSKLAGDRPLSDEEMQDEATAAEASRQADALMDAIEAQVARAFTVLGVRNGVNLKDDKVIFGYRDNISQPRFRDVYDPGQARVKEPIDPLGTILLGHPTRLSDIRYRVPQPKALGCNGSFNAFRVLAQDNEAFDQWLDEAADELGRHEKAPQLLEPGGKWWLKYDLDERGALREIIAAQMCGRWRNGTPYELSPDTPDPDTPVSLTNFDYSHASRCPAGAHMRRCNPRGGPIVQRIANYSRRLVRRGMTYGPVVNKAHPFDPANPDKEEWGLLGNFLCANLGAQFEAVMCDWLNLGLQDPTIAGTNDPLLGANGKETSWFDMTVAEPDGSVGTIRLRGLPRFVTCRGGAYLFLPSMPAIRHLAALTG